jgi:hypothetical protein
LSFFVNGHGLALNRSDTFDGDVFPGVKINVNFSDELGVLEGVDPTQESLCGIDFDVEKSPSSGTVYRLFLTKHIGDLELTLTGTRRTETRKAVPKLSIEQAAEVVKEKPWCAYFASQVNYGFQNAMSISYEDVLRPEFIGENFDSPGLIIESEDFDLVWEKAVEIRDIFIKGEAKFTGVRYVGWNQNDDPEKRLPSIFSGESSESNRVMWEKSLLASEESSGGPVEIKISHLEAENHFNKINGLSVRDRRARPIP